jgi:hypothetical protein
MLQEIPYGEYIENINETNNFKETNDSLDSINTETLPVSIEVIPHKAIMIHEVSVQGRHERECPNYIKWLIASSFCIPLVIVLSSVRLNNQ